MYNLSSFSQYPFCPKFGWVCCLCYLPCEKPASCCVFAFSYLYVRAWCFGCPFGYTPTAHSLVSDGRSAASMSCRGSVVDGCGESVATPSVRSLVSGPSQPGILSLPDRVQASVTPCNKKAASVLSLPPSSKPRQQLRSVQKQSVSGKSLPPGSVCKQSVVTQDGTCRLTLPPGSKKGDGFCFSLPPGSESGKKGKAHVLEDTPQQDLEPSGPEISQDQTLW